jgi:hypothetical protein
MEQQVVTTFWGYLVTPEHAPVAAISFAAGTLACYFTMTKLYFSKVIKMHEDALKSERELCDQRLSAMQHVIDGMKPVVEKFQRISERQLLKNLDATLSGEV